MARSPELGEPPDWLPRVSLPIWEADLRAERLFQCFGLRGPLSFNPTSRGRFNAPSGEYATTYVSTSIAGAFVETLLQAVPRDPETGRPLITRSSRGRDRLQELRGTSASTGRALRLADLRDRGLMVIGATNELATESSLRRQPLVQRWALALYRHPDRPDGIIYRARHDPACESLALFDRAIDLLAPIDAVDYLSLPDVLAGLMERYRVELIDDRQPFEG